MNILLIHARYKFIRLPCADEPAALEMAAKYTDALRIEFFEAVPDHSGNLLPTTLIRRYK